MRLHIRRRFRGNAYAVGETPWGVFTNLWPTALSKSDRKGGFWYLNVHAGPLFVEMYATGSKPLHNDLGYYR